MKVSGIILAMNENTKKYILLAIVVGGFLSIFFFEPYHQRLAYHNFIDKRVIFGVRNSFDVLSNIPFSLFGLLGLIYWFKYPVRVARKSWFACFLGVFLVGIGSAYYHYTPNNQTLIWDRLPLTVGFMGFLSVILSVCISKTAERWVLPLLISLGGFSVVYWAMVDDLRFYFYVQAIPLVVIPFVLVLFNSRDLPKMPLLWALICYLLAKATEFSDARIFELTNNQVSGHTIKHLLASLAPLIFAYMLKEQSKRQGFDESLLKEESANEEMQFEPN